MAELVFDCIGARPDKFAVMPSMNLILRIAETTGSGSTRSRCAARSGSTARRHYSAAEAERLNDLFGDTQRWADTLKPMQLSTIATMVPGFTGSIEIDLPLPLTYDLEIGSTRYFAVPTGEIPLLLLFSGTVFAVTDGRLAVQQVPWSKEAPYRMPLTTWREAIDAHFPDTAWIKMSTSTLDDLVRFKTTRALPTWRCDAVGAARPGGGERGIRSGRISGAGIGVAMTDAAHLEHARKVADAILYEGYLLYPYRQSTAKNHLQVPVRRADAARLPCGRFVRAVGQPDRVPVECADDAQVLVSVRFLQLQRRAVFQVVPGSGEPREVAALTVDGTEYTAWDEAIEREQQVCAEVGELLSGDLGLTLHAPGGESTQDVVVASTGRLAGRLVRSWDAIDGVIRLRGSGWPARTAR